MLQWKKIYYKFNKTGINEVYILFDISKTITTENVFRRINKIKESYFTSQFKDISIRTIIYKFYYCESLTSGNITNFNTKKLQF